MNLHIIYDIHGIEHGGPSQNQEKVILGSLRLLHSSWVSEARVSCEWRVKVQTFLPVMCSFLGERERNGSLLSLLRETGSRGGDERKPTRKLQ
jgi:hypothetical protein